MNNNIIKTNLLSWKYLISILVTIIIIVYILLLADYSAIVDFKKIYLLYITFLLILSVYLRAVRWSLLLNKENKKNKINLLFGIQFAGYFCSNVLPLRLGEVVKSYILAKKINLSTSFIFGTVILERILDMLAAGFIGLFIIFSNDNSLIEYKNKILFFLIISIFGILISFFLPKLNKGKNKNKIMKYIYEILSGFSSINNNNLILSLILTIGIWVSYILIVYFVFIAINFPLNYLMYLIILIISTLIIAIPSLPGNWGVYEAGLAALIIPLLNTDMEFALSIAVCLHLATFIPYTLIGGVYFIKYYFYDEVIINNNIKV